MNQQNPVDSFRSLFSVVISLMAIIITILNIVLTHTKIDSMCWSTLSNTIREANNVITVSIRVSNQSVAKSIEIKDAYIREFNQDFFRTETNSVISALQSKKFTFNFEKINGDNCIENIPYLILEIHYYWNTKNHKITSRRVINNPFFEKRMPFIWRIRKKIHTAWFQLVDILQF